MSSKPKPIVIENIILDFSTGKLRILGEIREAQFSLAIREKVLGVPTLIPAEFKEPRTAKSPKPKKKEKRRKRAYVRSGKYAKRKTEEPSKPDSTAAIETPKEPEPAKEEPSQNIPSATPESGVPNESVQLEPPSPPELPAPVKKTTLPKSIHDLR